MNRPVHLGIDVGGTASRWVACDTDGDVIARGQVSGATAHLFNPAEKNRLNLAFSAIADALAAKALAVSHVTVGLTGYGDAVFDQMTQMLAESFGVISGDCIIVDDMMLTYAGLFAPGEGHLISAGTGSIGLHIRADGSRLRVGGRGILIDDAGSGSWIALRALDQLYRCLDSTGTFDDMALLAQEIFATIGSDDWNDVRSYIYGQDRGVIGALAVAVGKAAMQNDSHALAILRDAGAELAQLALALMGRSGARPVGMIGGVLSLHPVLAEQIHQSLPGHDVRFLSADAALAAARMGLEPQNAWRHVLLGRI